jgi:hypothetical protein
LLAQYIAAFETADAATLERALRHDAALEMVGSRTWFAGRTTCLPYLATYVLGSPGDWRMLAIIANGQPAAAAYRRDADGTLRAFGIAVLTVTPTGIARIVVFSDPDLATACRPPETLGGPLGNQSPWLGSTSIDNCSRQPYSNESRRGTDRDFLNPCSCWNAHLPSLTFSGTMCQIQLPKRGLSMARAPRGAMTKIDTNVQIVVAISYPSALQVVGAERFG